jgi:hypothetical protein
VARIFPVLSIAVFHSSGIIPGTYAKGSRVSCDWGISYRGVRT